MAFNLRSDVAAVQGSYAEFIADFEQCIERPRVGFNGSNVRDRFFPTHNCRIDVNNATSEELAENVGHSDMHEWVFNGVCRCPGSGGQSRGV